MTGDLPAMLEVAGPTARTFPASWRDAAIRVLYDRAAGGVRCPGCASMFRRPAELRRLHGDHIVPYSRGGLTTWANLQLLCAACNLRKHAKV
jgi:5-methylcytosine-specific restriction endonuclease McrA